ncbi:MAG: hypothetical protein AAGF92_11400 [Myxococcota bacterium]
MTGFAMAALAAFPLYNIDAYGHLAQGREIAARGRVPNVDSFSFWKPIGQPWHNYEWGYDLLTWALYDWGGPNMLIGLKCLVVGATAYALVRLAVRLAPASPAAAPMTGALLLVMAPFARIRFTVRPQIFGFLFPALLLLGVHELYRTDASNRRKTWVLVGLSVMQVAWVNLHGSHLLGILMGGLFLAFSVRTPAFKTMLALVALQVAATACSPFGAAIVTDAISHVFSPAYREVVIEWGPWTETQPLYLLLAPAAMTLLTLLALGPVTRSSRFGLAYGVFCVVLSLMAFRSIRFVAHELLLPAPFIGAGLAARVWLRDRQNLVLGFMGASLVWALISAPRIEPFVPFGFGEPRLGHAWAVAEVLEDHVDSPRVVAPMHESWPLMFAVPDAKFLIDGRVPFYGPEWIQRVTDAFSNPAALQRLLDEYDANAVVLEHVSPRQLRALGHLSRSPDWVLAQVQDRQSLFVRADAASSFEPLQIIGPGYTPGRLLDTDVRLEDIDRELDWVGTHQNSRAIQSWVRGLRELRPLVRGGGRAGIRRYETEAEQSAARRSFEELAAASETYPGFTTIEVYRGLAALAACDLDQARTSLARAAYSGETRETALASFELVLRSSDESKRKEALAAIDGLLERDDAQGDPWLRAIRADDETRCP